LILDAKTAPKRIDLLQFDLRLPGNNIPMGRPSHPFRVLRLGGGGF
jgi:hypothetical protein